MKKGFTLVELIVVVIIIGILAMVGIPQYRKALERAQGAAAYAILGHLQEGEKLYYASNYTNPEYIPVLNNLDTSALRLLDVSLPASFGWNIAVTEDSTSCLDCPKFTATATRSAGPCSTAPNNNITMFVNRTTSNRTDNWKTCVDTL